MSKTALVLAACLAACGGAPGARPRFFPSGEPVPVSGPVVPGVERWDAVLVAFMRRWDVPGLTVAAAREGRLALARGYGYADAEERAPMVPDALLRVASVSKVLTALAALRLADAGRLDLDGPVSGWVALPPSADQRLTGLTVRHLLEHAGGWDRQRSGDPVARLPTAAAALGAPGPVTAPELARFALGLPLDFDPGSHEAYSNIGYVVLGRVLEAVAGAPYEAVVQQEVLVPAGISRMRIGGTREVERAPGEVRYEDHAGAPPVRSVFPGEGEVPRPYGWTSLAALDAAGGWIGSAIDLVRLMMALDGSRGTPLLSAARRDEMMARPPLPEWAGAPSWFGLGMQVEPVEGGAIWHHGGSMPGTTAEVLRTPGGTTVALLVSSRPADADVGRFEQELVDLVWSLAGGPAPEPADDLFPSFR